MVKCNCLLPYLFFLLSRYCKSGGGMVVLRISHYNAVFMLSLRYPYATLALPLISVLTGAVLVLH